MNRNDVIDVLTAVAAADRRTVGQADVEVWQAVIGDDDKQLALMAVRDHLALHPDVWLQPGHVHQRVRAMVRDQLEREPDSAREARQAGLAAKAAEDAAELAQRRGIEAVVPKARPSVNPLRVRCPWCHADVGQGCVIPNTQRRLTQTGAHPSRRDLARAQADEV